MPNFSIEIPNIEKLRDALAGYPQLASDRLKEAINKSLSILSKSGTQDTFQFKTPSALRTHYLELTWGAPGKGLRLATESNLSGAIWSNARYAIFVHEGTGPHLIRVVKKRVLANKKTGQIFGTVVHHPGTQPNRFLPRIMAKAKTEIDATFKEALMAILVAIAEKSSA